MAFISSLDPFESLPTRPPTPPRESTPSDAIDEALDDINDFLESSNEVAKLMSSISKKSAVSTPEQTPPSSLPPTTKTSSQDQERKRVDFAPFTAYSYHNTPDYHKSRESFKENASTPGLKSLPPSRERSFVKSRSILKPSRPSSEQSLAPAHNHRSLGEMLESMLKSLAKDGTEQRVDAYVSMLATFKAYKSLPDIDMKALKEKLRLLLHFIRRDIAAVDPQTGKADAHLMTRSMRFLMCLFVLPDLKPDAFDTEESASILDYSTSVLQSPEISKSMANHHLELVAQQKFGARVMTLERVLRILDTLNTLEMRIDGNNIVGRRVAIYQRLVEQVPGIMAANASDWLEHLFNSMLSSFRDVREPSTSVSITCAVKLGGRKDMSKAMVELLSRKNEDKTFCEFLIERLSADMNDKELCSSAFHIWSVPILFLRAIRPSSLDKSTLSSLLLLPHGALNKGAASVKATALLAWNKLVFAENPSLSTPPHFRNILRVPIRQQLKRQKDGDFSKSVGHVALSSYCALLYYALRPDASFEQLDLCWDEYVFDILSDVCVNSQKHAVVGCKILTTLLTSEAVWDENRANQIKKKNCHPWDFEIQELSRLDARWVRSRFSKILELFVVLLGNFPELCTSANSTSSLANDTDEPVFELDHLWTAMLSAVVDAGSQEITPSMDLKSAVAGITNFLSRIWSPYWLPGSTKGRVKTAIFANLLNTSLEKLGPSIFTDKILAKNSKNNAFEAISTPSHRNRVGGPVQSPALHILGLLSATVVKGHNQGEGVAELITAISKQALTSRTSRNAKLSFLADLTEAMARSVDMDSHDEDDMQTMSNIDALFSGPLHLAFSVMSESSLVVPAQSTQVGQDYKYILRIFAISLRATQRQFPAMEKLYSQCVAAVKKEAGEGGVLLAMTEPHAEMYSEYISTACKQAAYMGYAEMILRHDVRPKNRRVIELGRKSLWGGITSPVTKNADLEYKHLYPMLNKTLSCIYECLDEISDDGLTTAMNCVVAIKGYLLRVTAVQGVILRQLQAGVAILVRDQSRKIFSGNEHKAFSEKVEQLWMTVLAAVGNHPRKDSAYLQAFDGLIAAGLSCRRISIVNATVAFWNDSFGTEDDLEYPPQVAKALRKLKPTVELQLPGILPPAEEIPDSPLSIEDFDEESQKDIPPTKSPSNFFSPKRQNPTFRLSPSPLPRQSFGPDRLDRSSPFRRATTPRSKLRHEDSQIQFEAIQSSPIVDQDSQLLTERQKEVAERQRLVTTPLFHNISSPARKRASDISSDPLQSDTPDHRPSTPILQPALDDDVLGSSPTTASVSRRQSLSRRQSPVAVKYGPWKDEEEIPSSPPRGDDDESDSGLVVNLDQASKAISPLRLQSKLPAGLSHDELAERTKEIFSKVPDDLPIVAETIEHDMSSQRRSSLIDVDKEPRSSVEREMVHAQLVAEAHAAAGFDADSANKEQEINDNDVALTSSIVGRDQLSEGARHVSPEQGAVAATSDAPPFDGSTTDPISSEAFVVRATAPAITADTETALASTIPATLNADIIPDSQIAPQPLEGLLLEVDASRVMDSFSANVNEDNDLQQSQLHLSTHEEASQDSALEDSQHSRSMSMDSLNQTQFSMKRKRRRPSLTEQTKRVKTGMDLANWKYYAGFGNNPAKSPTTGQLLDGGVGKLLDIIVIQAEGEEKKDTVQASPAPATAAREQLVVKRRLGRPMQKTPILARRQSSRSSQSSPAPEQSLTAAQATQSPGPSLRRATSSRLSEILLESSAVESSSQAQGSSVTRRGRQSLISPTPIQTKRSSSRLAGSPISPELGYNNLPRARRAKRTLSQSLDAESQLEDDLSTFHDTHGPAAKRTRSMALPSAIKSSPDVRTPSNPTRSSRAAFVQVSPGDVESRRAFDIDGDHSEERVSKGKAVPRDEGITGNTVESQADVQLVTPAKKKSSQIMSGTEDVDEDVTGSGRKILSPKSIMSRLKGILADCKNMVFGSQERREMDDIMFEIKNEVFSKAAPEE